MPKEALDRIDEKKRTRIFRTASAEFARHGYHKANINSIAQRAGIGKGSIYLYFNNKRDLYYSTFTEAMRLQDQIIDHIEKEKLDPIARIERVFEMSLGVFPSHRNMYKMYFELSMSGNEKYFADLAQLLEKRSSEFFKNIITEGIAAGKIRKDLPVEHAAHVLDSVYSIFLATLSCRYQQERLRVFTNTDVSRDMDLIKSHMHQIVSILEAGIVASASKGRSRKKPSSRSKKT